MRVPDRILKSVAFFARVITKGESREWVFRATGFIVGIPSSVPNRQYRFIVTAGHVVDNLLLGEWVMRVNTKDGRSIGIQGDKNHKWWRHPNPAEENTVDVAVTPFPMTDEVDIDALPINSFLDDKTLAESGVGPGDDIFMVGLLSKMAGQPRNIPIVRTGNVAMIPGKGELVPGVNVGRAVVDAEAYLIEARSIGGISGSPVFVVLTGNPQARVSVSDGGQYGMVGRWFMPGEIFLLGLVNGHWDIFAEDKNDPSIQSPTKKDKESGRKDIVNLGIAVVIPAQKIKEVIYHPELVALIADRDRQIAEAEGTTMLGGVPHEKWTQG